MPHAHAFTGTVACQGFATCNVCGDRFEYTMEEHPLYSDLVIELDENQKQTNLDPCPNIGCDGELLKW